MFEEKESNKGILEPSSINWPGLLAGVLMLILPFLGVWWKAAVGGSAFKLAISPFKYEVLLAGKSVTSALISYFIIAAKLTVIIGGVFMVIGSLTARLWWGKKILGWGTMKVFWMMVSLLVIVTIGALLANKFLPSMISGMIGDGGSINLNIPYLVGNGHVILNHEEGVTISGPIATSLTYSFGLAVVTAALGLVTKIYQGRIIEEPEKAEEEESEEETTESSEEKEEKNKKEEETQNN